MVSCVVTKFIKEARSVFGPQFRLVIDFPDISEKFLVPVRTVEIFRKNKIWILKFFDNHSRELALCKFIRFIRKVVTIWLSFKQRGFGLTIFPIVFSIFLNVYPCFSIFLNVFSLFLQFALFFSIFSNYFVRGSNAPMNVEDGIHTIYCWAE